MPLHITVYRCIDCEGPVVAVSVGNPGPVGDAGEGNDPPAGQLVPVGNPVCMRCGHVQNNVHGEVVHLAPVAWD